MSRRVLLVEDDEWMAQRFLHVLRSAGYDASHAHDGLAAMDEIDKVTPDVLIVDFFMPGPNGLVLLHELQSHSDLATIPVILCSNMSSEIPRGALQAYGIDIVLDKTTMMPADLISGVRKVLA